VVCRSCASQRSSSRPRVALDMALHFVVAFLSASACSALAIASGVSDPLASVEASLSRSCGVQCLALLHGQSSLLEPGAGGNASGSHALLDAIAAEADRRLEHAVALTSAQAATTLAGSKRASLSASGVPCSTPAACAMKTLGANKCNYARVALQQAYNELNVATHALGELVSSLCGCMRAGHVSTCALRGVPAACTFPYTVYSKAFAGSVQVWEAVKASTATCILHGDAGLMQ